MIADTLQILSSLTLGLFVGSLLTEAIILVPYWRSIKPEIFLKLHGTLGPQLYCYFAPLTILATLLPAATAIFCIWAGTTTRTFSVIVAVLMLIILGIYFYYFKDANDSFKSRSVGADGLPAELQRWATWHWIRTVIGFGAFLISLLVLIRN